MVKFSSYSKMVKEGPQHNQYSWCVFVDEEAEVLERIKSVEYTLHPTFPDPVRTVTDRSTRFALFSSGWGEFRMKAAVTFTDGTQEEQSFHLELFKDNWPGEKPPQEFPDDLARTVYDLVAQGDARWRKLDTLSSKTGLSEQEVNKALGQLADKNLVRKAEYPSIDGKELWGPTTTVGIMPKFK